MGANAPVEVFAIDQWRHLFEVNFFGHIAVTQTLLPALIRSKGRVVNISSVGGKIAMATYGPYAGTKFALEAVSDSLRREIAPLGVQVVVVEPAAVRTEMGGRAIATAQELVSTMTPEQSERYGGLMHAITAQTASAHQLRPHRRCRGQGDRQGGDGAQAAHSLHRWSRRRTAYPLARILPDRMLDRILAAALRSHFPKGSKQILNWCAP